MQLSNFDFHLPDKLIASRPVTPRSNAKLLVCLNEQIIDSKAHCLPQFLKRNDLLIFNDTKVSRAFLTGNRETNRANTKSELKIFLLLIQRKSEDSWFCYCKPGKRLQKNDLIRFSNYLLGNVIEKSHEGITVQFNLAGKILDSALHKIGMMPLPPYILKKRNSDIRDFDDYQTIFAKNSGSIAAPTAALHFDQSLFENLNRAGINYCFVTLHVGLGTFLPVKVDDISKHKMHSEFGSISEDSAKKINETKLKGGRVIPVGTTSMRLTESASQKNGRIMPFDGSTDIFIKPGYKFKVSSGLITNFHLPKSSLLILVSALIGDEKMRKVYSHAVKENYRFFSYGDMSLLIP